jgi:hypothetical protein
MSSRGGRYAGLIIMGFTLMFAAFSPAEARDSSSADARAAARVARPAQWETFDILVDLQNLPQNYSCDDLWYKFRDVLRWLGAGPNLTITPYDCGYVGGGESRSPHVQVKFELPRPLQGAETRYAQMSVVDRNVQLAPGFPRWLLPSDCELVEQLVGGLFPALPLRVESADFHCSAVQPSYTLTVNARIVVPASGVAAAR